MTVTADQRVTLVGRASSLRSVLEDVCYRAGINLLSWDADDRAFGGAYHELPVTELLTRLLRSQSFLLEAMAVGDATRVTSLRVLGDPAVASARRARGIRSGRRTFDPPPVLLDAAFSSDAVGSAEQQAALATLASRISGDPAQLQGFLSTDPLLIAQAIERYKGVEAPLRELQKKYPDPRIARKIDDVIAALRTLPAHAR